MCASFAGYSVPLAHLKKVVKSAAKVLRIFVNPIEKVDFLCNLFDSMITSKTRM